MGAAMITGTQIVAPKGKECLVRNELYYFLANLHSKNTIALAHFIHQKSGWTVEICHMKSDSFFSGLIDGTLVNVREPSPLPPWLSHAEPVDIYKWKEEKGEKHASLIAERLDAIGPLVDNLANIILSENPNAEISKTLRASGSTKNRQRVRCWFFAYVLHGHSENALLPEYFRNGHHDRNPILNSGVKLGRPFKNGSSRHGFACDKKMSDLIVDGVSSRMKAGMPYFKLYQDIVVKVFGCKSKRKGGTFHFVHPRGEPFPSPHQVRYQIDKNNLRYDVYRQRNGENRARNERAPHQGSFVESVGNLMERTEFDGYYLAERPKGLLAGTHHKSVCVVRAVCVVSGCIVGIGFSLQSETHTAYDMCRFSMAYGKKEFCALFGLHINEDDWPCQGLPRMDIMDRGPGFKDVDVIANAQSPIVELAPSYSGQSKACIESKHPRKVRMDGAQAELLSDKNFIELARREIIRVMADNRTSDASSRLTPEMVASGVSPNPLSIWNYLSARGRSDAAEVTADEAVARFLPERTVKLSRDGIEFFHTKYRGKSLDKTDIMSRVPAKGTVDINAHVLSACVRHIWIKYKGRIHKLDAMLRIADDEQQLYMPIEDIIQYAEEIKDRKRDLAESKPATCAALESAFESATGKAWDGSKRVKGRRKQSSADISEISIIRRKM